MLRWLRNSFLTGVIVATPLTVTFWLIYSFVNFVDSTIKPLIPARYNPESYLPFAIPGMGLVIAILFLTFLGALAANIFGRTLLNMGERILNSVPLVRNIYGALKQLVETALAGQNKSFREVVLVEYPMKGLWALAFVTADAASEVRRQIASGEQVIGVFVPTTPNPTSGFLLYTARRNVIQLKMTVEEAAKLIFSFGIVTPGQLPEGAIPSDSPLKAGAGLMPDDPPRETEKTPEAAAEDEGGAEKRSA